jgi:ribosome-associated heat shock protein Hsp15
VKPADPAPSAPGIRLDRWLWVARFFRTRPLAKAAIEAGHVLLLPDGDAHPHAPALHGVRSKPGKEVGPGDWLLIQRGETVQTIRVLAVEERRGGAVAASRLFEESDASIEARESARARRQLERAGLKVPPSRPDKRERRERQKLKQTSGEGNPPPDVLEDVS